MNNLQSTINGVVKEASEPSNESLSTVSLSNVPRENKEEAYSNSTTPHTTPAG